MIPNIEQIETIIKKVSQRSFLTGSLSDVVSFAISCLDLTTLEGDDTPQKVIELCQKSQRLHQKTAAVCVYPVFAQVAKQQLKDSSTKVACVAGGFPSGQLPLSLKVAEVRYAVEQGADEIDTVISRGKFLEGRFDEVEKELLTIRSLCPNQQLKVILEVSDLKSIEAIYHASMMAMRCGADFIKTSTGKTSSGATPVSFTVMLFAIRDFLEESSRRVGIKPAGGISDVDTALLYIKLLEEVLGVDSLSKQYFRIGTSSLADKLQATL